MNYLKERVVKKELETKRILFKDVNIGSCFFHNDSVFIKTKSDEALEIKKLFTGVPYEESVYTNVMIIKEQFLNNFYVWTETNSRIEELVNYIKIKEKELLKKNESNHKVYGEPEKIYMPEEAKKIMKTDLKNMEERAEKIEEFKECAVCGKRYTNVDDCCEHIKYFSNPKNTKGEKSEIAENITKDHAEFLNAFVPIEIFFKIEILETVGFYSNPSFGMINYLIFLEHALLILEKNSFSLRSKDKETPNERKKFLTEIAAFSLAFLCHVEKEVSNLDIFIFQKLKKTMIDFLLEKDKHFGKVNLTKNGFRGMLILMQNKFENLKSLAMSEKDLKINDTLIVKNFRDLGGLAINALKLLENGDI